MIVEALYPNYVGLSESRTDRRTNRSPDYFDWDQMVAEVLAHQDILEEFDTDVGSVETALDKITDGAGSLVLSVVASPTIGENQAAIYAADVDENKTAIHCKTEDGDIVKLFTSANIEAVEVTGSDADSVARGAINDILAILVATGLMAPEEET